jgi:glycosyltransferase involved in cell wall biosynthesis
MRILIVTHYFAPDSGAAAVRLTRLARLLVERGHSVTVLATMPHYPKGEIAENYRGKLFSRETVDGMTVIRAWLWATPSKSITRRLVSQISFMLTATLRGLFLPRHDVALIEAQPVFTALAGMTIARLKGIPYAANVSDFWPEYLTAVGVMTERHPLYRLFLWLINLIYRGAAAIVTLYPTLIEGIEARTGNTGKTQNIFNAVDLKRFTPQTSGAPFRAKHELGEQKLITFVGTFGTHIDFKTMLDAAALLAHRDDLRFVLIGTGGQNDAVRERLAQDDLKNVIQIGWVEHDEMPTAWAVSHLTFWAIRNHPLYRDILQSKMYEAMASGIPLAIATEGITAEILAESGSGLTVPFEDAAGLAGAIAQIIDDDALRTQMSVNARRYAEEQYDPEKVAGRYEAILQKIARH